MKLTVPGMPVVKMTSLALRVPGATAGLAAAAPMFRVPLEPAVPPRITLAVRLASVTVPPLAMVSVPRPSEPMTRPWAVGVELGVSLMVQIEPAPVTVTLSAVAVVESGPREMTE